jgi:hypothetical protein
VEAKKQVESKRTDGAMIDALVMHQSPELFLTMFKCFFLQFPINLLNCFSQCLTVFPAVQTTINQLERSKANNNKHKKKTYRWQFASP